MTCAHARDTRERGVVYLLVLSTTVVVLAIVLGAIAVVRAQRAEAVDTVNAVRASALARSGVELALSRLDASGSNWRDDYVASEMAGTNVAVMDRAVLIYRLTDPADGDLRDDPWEDVEITAYALWNDAQRVMSVRATPRGTAYAVLSSSIHARGELVFNATSFVGDRVATSNSDIKGQNVASVQAPVAAAGSVSGGTFSGGTRSAQAQLSMPNASDVVKYYKDIGQQVSIGSIAPGGSIQNAEVANGTTVGGVLIKSDVLVIDCAGRDLEIRDCRLAITLVLLDAGDASGVSNSVSWKPPRDGMPALICGGKFAFDLESDPLRESATGVTLNSVIPADDATTDSDTSDSYPSLLQGLFYADDTITFDGETNIAGCVVGESDITVSGTVLVQPSAMLDRAPPPMFASPDRVVLQRGTLRRVIP
jgi:hypothetical protein